MCVSKKLLRRNVMMMTMTMIIHRNNILQYIINANNNKECNVNGTRQYGHLHISPQRLLMSYIAFHYRIISVY
jgi:hypothetical protein